MTTPTEPTSRAAFDAVYDASVLDREFVEYREYYAHSRLRFWRAFQRIEALGLPRGARALDIGGGIMGVLTARLLGFEAHVGDVTERAAGDVAALGLGFTRIDLFRDGEPAADRPFDLVILQEVIEHIPQPPSIVLGRIARHLGPGGLLFLTTPNGHRFRNLVYMALGREILDIYRYPAEGEALGHQHEYTMKQMLWQMGAAGFDVMRAEYVEDGWAGATPAARIARTLSRPVTMVPHFRNSLFISARLRPAG